MIKFVLIFILYRGEGVYSVGTQDFNSLNDCHHAGRMMSAMMPIGPLRKRLDQRLEWKCVPNND